jgi:hypothetical protein
VSLSVSTGSRLRNAGLPRRAMLLAPTLGLASPASLLAQANAKKESEAALLRNFDLPSDLEKVYRVVAERVGKPGKERIVSVGQLDEKGSAKASALRQELPGRFRLEKDGRAILGSTVGAPSPQGGLAANDDEDDLIESLFLDRQESALYAVAGGASLRVLGYQVQATRGRTGYAGPYFDIYEITGRSDGKNGSVARSKRFVFDSMSGRLQRVHYFVNRRGASTVVETRFSEWSVVDGVAIPGVVERLENGSRTLRYQSTGHSVSAKANDGLFDRV